MLNIRHFLLRDLKDALFLEREAFGDEAWPEDKLIHYLKDRNHLGLVVELYGTIVGYYVYQYTTYRYDIIRIVVANKWRRHKIGSSMINRLFSKLGNNSVEYPYKRSIINAVVPENNLNAQLFFRYFGFTADAVLNSGDYLMRYRFSPKTHEIPSCDAGRTFMVDSLTGIDNG